MSEERTTEVIHLDDLSELSAYLDLAKARGLLLREMVGTAGMDTLRLNVNAVLDAIEEATAIVQAVNTVPIDHTLI